MNFLRKMALFAVVAFTFQAAPVGAAQETGSQQRAPAAENKGKKKTKKAAKKAAKAAAGKVKSAKAKKGASKKTAKKPAVAKAKPERRAAPRTRSHYPAEPQGELPEMANEDKDELPAPAQVEPQDD